MTTEALSVSPRRAPVQRRSIERVNRILDVTAELVRESGIDAVRTTEIARRADIKLASLYRYFPNKTAILKSLAERQLNRLQPHIDRFLEEFDLDQGFEQLVDTYVQFYREEPGYMELWSGIQAMPELHDLEMKNLLGLSKTIAKRAETMLPHLEADELWQIAVIAARTCGSVLRLAMTMEDETAEDLIFELKQMIKIYLKGRLSV